MNQKHIDKYFFLKIAIYWMIMHIEFKWFIFSYWIIIYQINRKYLFLKKSIIFKAHLLTILVSLGISKKLPLAKNKIKENRNKK